MFAAVERISVEHDTKIATLAHVGDGNLHPLIVVDPRDAAARARAERAFDEILTEALALGGTISGEHGVGLLKRNGMRQELSTAVLDMHRAVKQALDPHGILNPGKMFSVD